MHWFTLNFFLQAGLVKMSNNVEATTNTTSCTVKLQPPIAKNIAAKAPKPSQIDTRAVAVEISQTIKNTNAIAHPTIIAV